MCADPRFDLGRVESDEASPFDVRDPAFVNEAPYVTDLYAEHFGDLGDVDQVPSACDRAMVGTCCVSCQGCADDFDRVVSPWQVPVRRQHRRGPTGSGPAAVVAVWPSLAASAYAHVSAARVRTRNHAISGQRGVPSRLSPGRCLPLSSSCSRSRSTGHVVAQPVCWRKGQLVLHHDRPDRPDVTSATAPTIRSVIRTNRRRDRRSAHPRPRCRYNNLFNQFGVQ